MKETNKNQHVRSTDVNASNTIFPNLKKSVLPKITDPARETQCVHRVDASHDVFGHRLGVSI